MDILTQDAPERINLLREHWLEMLGDVRKRATEEACGFVAGEGITSRAVFPLTNVHHSPVRYALDPLEQFGAFQRIAENGWKLLAIYHSHLGGPATPSPTDKAGATYPEAVYIIWSRVEQEMGCRGFQINQGKVREIEISVIESGEAD